MYSWEEVLFVEQYAPVIPFPLRDTLSGVIGVLFGMETDPLLAPFDVGLKVTLNVQVPADATVVPLQVLLERAKSPLTLSVPKVTLEALLFVRVNVCGALVVPIAWSPKAFVDGLIPIVVMVTVSDHIVDTFPTELVARTLMVCEPPDRELVVKVKPS